MKVAVITTDNREQLRKYSLPEPFFGTAPEALLEGFARIPDIEVHVLSGTRLMMEKSPEKLAPNIWFHSIYVPRLGWTMTAFQGCARAMRRKLNELQPDIVHGQGTERDCALDAVFSGFPNVLTIHGNMAELARMFKARPGSFGWLSAQLENIALKRTLGVFCNSEYTENLVKTRAPKTWRVPNPLRMAFFETPRTAAPAKKCTLLNIGLVSERKRQLELLDVARRLHADGLEFEFLFVGALAQGDYSDKFMNGIKEAEAKGYARHSDHKSVAELIDSCDSAHGLVHFPSEEAFGLVAAEGIARGMKFFCSRVGGLVDIGGGVPGVEFFDPEDWKGLSDGIANWIRQGYPKPDGGARIMKERYHPSVIARRHVEIYEEVLKNRRK